MQIFIYKATAAKSALWVATICMLAGLTGCGYRLGNYTPPGIRTVYIAKPEVKERLRDPRLGEYAQQKVRSAFITDGSLKVSNSSDADSTLYLNVVEYRTSGAGSAKLASDDPDQQIYSTTIWSVSVQVAFKLVPRGVDPDTVEAVLAQGQAEFTELVDLSVMRQDALRQALADAAGKIVRDVVDSGR